MQKSTACGYCYGTSFFNLWIDMKSAHGNLSLAGSSGFAMTTAGKLPPAVRMEALPIHLQRFGRL